MKKRLTCFLPVYTVLAGLVCAWLQSRLFSALDGHKLIPEGQPEVLPLAVIAVVSIVVFLLSVTDIKSRHYRVLCPLPLEGIGCLAAAVGCVYLYTLPGEGMVLFEIVKLLAAGTLLFMGISKLMGNKPSLLLPAALCLCMMLMCFGQYPQWGRNTQLLFYLFPALSALFAALYSLQYVILELPEGSGKRTLFFNQAALFCSVSCLYTQQWPYYLAISLWLLGGLFITPCTMKLPEPVKKCIARLEKAGYTAYAVGGCVRDSALGITPHDYDLCTSATPEQLCQVFEDCRLIRNGEKHGTVGVVMGDQVYEITTYRTESGYSDSRHPDSVEFVDQIEKDLARRDFTVNAMAFHPKTGYLDPYGGMQDLFGGVLRTVGQPEKRFSEDALRILRGVRFACRFQLKAEPETLRAMQDLSPQMEHLAKERIFSEMNQILCLANDRQLLEFAPVLLQVLPQLKPCVGFAQHNPHHKHDVFTHTAKVLCQVPPEPALRWAALLHDAGKPETFTQDEKGMGHFYGHAQKSAVIACQVLQELKAPKALQEQVVFLVEHHMDELRPDKAMLRRKLSKYGPEKLTMLIQLQQADMGGKAARGGQQETFAKMLELVQRLQKEEGRLQIRDLAINGNDLMEIGYPAGPTIGACQRKLLQLVLEQKLPNTPQALLQKAEEMKNTILEEIQ